MKIIDKIKQRIETHKHPTPVDEMEPCRCKNCNYTFKGHFCPNCGQEVAEFNRPFGFILIDLLGNFFAFDTRFFKTFKDLLSKPGFITSEFFKGRRMRYSPPARVLVFLSFILFFLLQSLSNRSLNKALDTQIINDSVSHVQTTPKNIVIPRAETIKLADVSSLIPADSAFSSLKQKAEQITEETDSSQIILSNNNGMDITLAFNKDLRSNLNKVADQIEASLDKAQTPKERQKLVSYMTMCRMPELVIAKVFDMLSWAFFALVPAMALILELFYIKKRHRYIKHLVFSSHVHSYMAIILIIIALLELIFHSGTEWLVWLLLLTVPVYVFIAMKRFYGQRNKPTIFKFLGLGIIYQMVLLTAMVLVIVESFLRF